MADHDSKAADIRTFPKGAVILEEGATSHEMILLLQGNVGVYKNFRMATEQQLRVIGQGGFHGELSLFLGREQPETLVALTNVVVLVIGRRGVTDFFVHKPDMAVSIVEGICHRLADAEEELAMLTRGSLPQEASRRSALFPGGHGQYTLPMAASNPELLYSSKVTCPLCGHSFDNLGVIMTKLRLERTDPDLRARYRDIEPLHYEIISCPNCFYSASTGLFETASKRLADAVNQKVGPYKLEMYIKTGYERDTFTVFAGYFLALLCAPVCFDDHQLITAGLWLKISRLYRDLHEEKLALYAAGKALADYHYAYENLHMDEKQSQQLCYLMGDLQAKLGNVDEARSLFFFAKTNKAGTPMLSRLADQRLEEIRELKKAAQI